MQATDTMRVTFDQNPAVAEALAQAKPGDEGKCEVRYTVKAKDDEGVDLIIEAVVPEGYEVDEDSTGSEITMPSPTGAAMPTPTAMMVKKIAKT